MPTKIKTLKTLSFEANKNGEVRTSGSKEKTLRSPSSQTSNKPGLVTKLLKKVPAHTFVNDAFDGVTGSTLRAKDDGRGNREHVGMHRGTRGSQSLRFADSALSGTFNREAVIGGYVDKSGAVSGRYGTAGYEVHGKGEAKASVSGDGRLDTNGLVLNGGARANASVEVTASASARSQSITILGVETDAAVEANGRLVAELNAEASGTAQFTRKPPTAVLEGRAGVSAVAKVEGDIRAHAGPFAIDASAYASAGAEASAAGVVAYRDGKLTLSGSAGAAFGLGAGAEASVTVDVGMIHDAADLNGDGKLDIKDLGVGAVALIKFGAKKVGDRDGDGRVTFWDARIAVGDVRSNVRNFASSWKERLVG